MMSTPTREASSLVEATIPCRAWTGSRDAAREGTGIDAAIKKIKRIEQARFIIVHL